MKPKTQDQVENGPSLSAYFTYFCRKFGWHLLRNPSIPCVGDYTLYQLKIMYADSLELDASSYRKIAEAVRYGNHLTDEKDFANYLKSIQG